MDDLLKIASLYYVVTRRHDVPTQSLYYIGNVRTFVLASLCFLGTTFTDQQAMAQKWFFHVHHALG